MQTYGPHLIIDGYRGSYSQLGSYEAVCRFLSEAPIIMGMNIIQGPLPIKYDGGKNPKEWGITGTVVIAESHLSIHTYPEARVAWIDLFSCKPFEVEVMLEMVRERFEFEEMDWKVVTRGLRFCEEMRVHCGKS